MRLYITANPFKMTNIETKESKEFDSLKELLDAVTWQTADVYVYDLDKLARAISNYYFMSGYKTLRVDQVEGRFPTKHFMVVGSALPTSKGSVKTYVSIKSKRVARATTTFYNAARLFGRAPVKDIIGQLEIEDEHLGMSEAISRLIVNGHTKMTLSSNAFHDLMYRCFFSLTKAGKDRTYFEFDKYFPYLLAEKNGLTKEEHVKKSDEVHDFIIPTLQGGLCYINPKYDGKEVFDGISYDVNSMYPSIMKHKQLPIGEAYRFEGKWDPTNNCHKYKKAYFQRMRIGKLKLKEGGIPCISKGDGEGYHTETHNLEITLNHIDLMLMERMYEVEDVEYLGGYMFRTKDGLFNNYIDYWMNEKVESEKRGDMFGRKIAKLMLNNAFGKFATKTDKRGVQFVQNSNGSIGARLFRNPGISRKYAPVGCYITSYGRLALIEAIEANKDRFVYSDTDSIYLTGKEPAKGIDIHESNLGAWKEEFKWEKMNIIGKKQYVVVKDNGEVKITCAGIPVEVSKKDITYDNFVIGAEYNYDVYGYNSEGMRVSETYTYKLEKN